MIKYIKDKAQNLTEDESGFLVSIINRSRSAEITATQSNVHLFAIEFAIGCVNEARKYMNEKGLVVANSIVSKLGN